MDMDQCLENAVSWARKAGALQRERFRTELSIEYKSSSIDLVTEVDKASEQLILSGIREAYPEHGILGEETGMHPGRSEYCWVVDPLDGTTNYAQGLPIFAVSIALKHQDAVQLGVVYAPLVDQLFTAVRGRGAFLNGSPISVGNKARLNEAVVASGFPYDAARNKDNNSAHFSHMVPKTRGLRRMGAAAYDLAMVACGGLDGYWEFNLSPWDVAAGELLVQEAGGVVIPLPHKRGVSLIAANSALAPLIQRELAYVDMHWDGAGFGLPLT